MINRGESLPESGRFTRGESKPDKLEIYQEESPCLKVGDLTAGATLIRCPYL